jgi:dTDP-4-dehydrorhamnose 3,5-epimerase
MRTNKDTRGKCWYDVLPIKEGQVDIACNYPGTVRAFHYHYKKREIMMVLQGEFKFVVTKSGKKIVQYLSPGESIEIEPGCWHGYQVIGGKPGIILEWADEKHDVEKPDDDREVWNKFDDWEVERK